MLIIILCHISCELLNCFLPLTFALDYESFAPRLCSLALCKWPSATLLLLQIITEIVLSVRCASVWIVLKWLFSKMMLLAKPWKRHLFVLLSCTFAQILPWGLLTFVKIWSGEATDGISQRKFGKLRGTYQEKWGCIIPSTDPFTHIHLHRVISSIMPFKWRVLEQILHHSDYTVS